MLSQILKNIAPSMLILFFGLYVALYVLDTFQADDTETQGTNMAMSEAYSAIEPAAGEGMIDGFSDAGTQELMLMPDGSLQPIDDDSDNTIIYEDNVELGEDNFVPDIPME